MHRIQSLTALYQLTYTERVKAKKAEERLHREQQEADVLAAAAAAAEQARIEAEAARAIETQDERCDHVPMYSFLFRSERLINRCV